MAAPSPKASGSTAEEMREWVEYCNGREGRFARLRMNNGHDQPQDVHYWSIGNEPDTARSVQDDLTPEKYADRYYYLATQIRSIDPTARLGFGAVVGMTGFGASAPGDTVMEKFGFTAERVAETVLNVMARSPQ